MATYGLRCPHCTQPASVRSSRAETETLRSIIFRCSNLLCGFTFGADLQVTHQITPSAIPNPLVRLRIGTGRSAPRPREVPEPANDEAASGPAVPLSPPGPLTAMG